MHFVDRHGRPQVLGYCANVHPGETLADVLAAIANYGAQVRAELGVATLSYGLWLSRSALQELEREGTDRLRRALAEAGLFVVTLNGFPYGDFHAAVVKRKVYHPDLASPERRAYLLGLAGVLAELLPADSAEGTISTLPLGHREEPSSQREHPQPLAAALQLCGLSEDLARLRDRSGRSVRICLEPEPGCWLESSADARHFFCEILPDAARRCGTDLAVLQQHLGLCYDTCHQAVCFEDAADSIQMLTAAGVRIAKAQLSSALELTRPDDPALRAELLAFAEPRFLHQVRSRNESGAVLGVDDLPALDQLPRADPLRVHFHVPIHHARLAGIVTTRPFLEQALPVLAALQPPPHLEVETYTWSVLPAAARPKSAADLVSGLCAELNFAKEALS
jgi:sugar phosphate isomerase/epimerase